jgi:hypothetical protein
MSNTLLDALRARVDEMLAPHVRLYGDAAPVVVMARDIVAEAERIASELGARKLTTAEAAHETGWHPETLQSHARERLNGETMAPEWASLEVDLSPVGGYLFTAGTIPEHPRAKVA